MRSTLVTYGIVGFCEIITVIQNLIYCTAQFVTEAISAAIRVSNYLCTRGFDFNQRYIL